MFELKRSRAGKAKSISYAESHNPKYLMGRDPRADEVPTGQYFNNFGTALAASIRGASQAVESNPGDYEERGLYVCSRGPNRTDIFWAPQPPADENTIVHYVAARHPQAHIPGFRILGRDPNYIVEAFALKTEVDAGHAVVVRRSQMHGLAQKVLALADCVAVMPDGDDGSARRTLKDAAFMLLALEGGAFRDRRAAAEELIRQLRMITVPVDDLIALVEEKLL